MATIPQRQLRNEIGDVLRRAERGERILITVSGREVAELGPVPAARYVQADRARARLAELPKTAGMMDDIRQLGGGLVDPFA